MDLVPGVFNEGDGDIAEGWRELGVNPSSSYLFVSVIASPENAGVECISDDSGDVGGLDGALCRVFLAVSADVGVVEGIAGGLNIHSESVDCCCCQCCIMEWTASISRCWGTELKKPTRSSLVAWREMSAGV